MSCSVTENYGALLQRAHRQNYLIGVPNSSEGGTYSQGLFTHLPRKPLLSSRVNEGKEERPERLLRSGLLLLSSPTLLRYCPGARYVASPALRIASKPSSALSSTVVLTLLR